MKKILTILFLVPILSYSQEISLVTKTDSIFAKIQGYGDKDFITTEGDIAYKDVVKAYYYGDELNEYLSKKIVENGIQLYKSDASIADIVSQRKLDLSIEGEGFISMNSRITDLENKLDVFRSKRNSGFAMQASGVTLTILGASSESGELIIAGTLLNAIGWIINWGAGKSLRKRRGR